MKRTLNIYNTLFSARCAFENYHGTEIKNFRDLTIRDDDSFTVFAPCVNEETFRMKYLQGWIWNEINDCANLPYDLWVIAQSRILQE